LGAEGTGGPATALASAAPQATRISVGVLNILPDAPVILMRERGYLAEQGLDADYQVFDSGARMVQPLAVGQLDFAPGSPSVGLFNAVARGVNLKIVADWVSGAPGHPVNWIVARKDLVDSGAVRDYADLRGRRVAISARGTSAHVQVGRMAERGGFSLAEIDLVEIGYPDMAAALLGRSIDVAVMTEPGVTRAEEQEVGVRWRSSDELIPGQVAAVIMYGPSFLEQRPDVGRRAMVAYLKGVRDYYRAFTLQDAAMREAVIPLLMQATPFKDRALYDRVRLGSVNPDGHVNIDALEADYRWFVSEGLLADTGGVRPLVVGDFVDYALQQLGPFSRP
jgi:NitT/TauT family transport system substrate-binding protein